MPVVRLVALLLGIALAASGCISSVVWRPELEASGDGLAPASLPWRSDNPSYIVETERVHAFLSLEQNLPSFVLIGPFVPFVPVPRIHRRTLRFSLQLAEGSAPDAVQPDSVRIWVGETAYAPFSVEYDSAPAIRPSGSTLRPKDVVRFHFDNPPDPTEPFTIQMDGLPVVHVTAQSQVHYSSAPVLGR
jgi:hypothetical protein